MTALSRLQERFLLVLAIAGFLGPNGVFLYYAAADPGLLREALANPVALVFILEAFALMALFAWLIHQRGIRSPGWVAFVVLSLLGSLLCSVPAFLYLASRRGRAKDAA